MIGYIRVAREVMDPPRKQNFDGGGDQGSHRGHWDRRGGIRSHKIRGIAPQERRDIWWGHAIMALTVRPCHQALTMINLDHFFVVVKDNIP